MVASRSGQYQKDDAEITRCESLQERKNKAQIDMGADNSGRGTNFVRDYFYL